MISLSVAPDEARKIMRIITEFLNATHGAWNVGKIQIKSIKKQQNQIEIIGKVDMGTIFEYKWVNFTVVLDSQYRLVSYERA